MAASQLGLLSQCTPTYEDYSSGETMCLRSTSFKSKLVYVKSTDSCNQFLSRPLNVPSSRKFRQGTRNGPFSCALWTCESVFKIVVGGSGSTSGTSCSVRTASTALFVNTKVRRITSARNLRQNANLGGDGDVEVNEAAIDDDFYSVLGLTPDATSEEIKKAYHACMKSCHPDLSGNDAEVTNFCIFINEIYEVLSDPEQRFMYDEINGYTVTAINPFKDRSCERNYAFVDEFSCIGCKNCAHTAPETFAIESDFGRARVACQTGNPALVQTAIDTCPVDCIHWVTAGQLSLLEDEMRRVERVNVGLMLSGMGYQSPDVFALASWRWEKRQAQAVNRARVRMMKESGKNGNDVWWKFNWGVPADEETSRQAAGTYASERAAKTAAATRRWREFSRRGGDRRTMRNLPSPSRADPDPREKKAVLKK